MLDADLTAGLAEAIEHGFLVETDERLEFRHELIAQAVEEDLLPFTRVRYHAAIASALADRPAVAAHHWIKANDGEAARTAYVAAAAEASARNAPADALAAIEEALNLAPGAKDATELKEQAAEAAFAAGRATRAIAFAEAAIAGLDARRDRVRLGLLHERLGHYRRAVGDNEGAMAAKRRAVELVPREPTPERATVLAALAQLLMLDGTFSDAERHAREAIRIARECSPRAVVQEAHATITLAVAMAWGSTPEDGVRLLEDAGRMAAEVGELDERFRVHANLTTVLDLLGRRADAVEVAYRGIEEAKAAGLEAVYGNFLRVNASDSLFILGRWEEARAFSEIALEWQPVGIHFLISVVNLATVAIEMSAGEEAGRLLGQTLLELEAVRDSQLAVPFYLASASFAVWRGDFADAGRVAGRGWELVRVTEDWVLTARMAATAAEVHAAEAVDALERHDLPALAAARSRAPEIVAEAERLVQKHGVSPTIGSRQMADAYLATARAFCMRIDDRDDPDAWSEVADRWGRLVAPYEVARARWHEAEALLAGAGRAGRTAARRPILEATGIALELGAKPLLRQLRELAHRALIPLPDEVETVLADGAAPQAARPDPSLVELLSAPEAQPSALMRGIAGEALGGTRRLRPPGHLRAQRPGAGGPAPARPGTDEPGDRRAPVHHPQDRRRPRREHPCQARRVGPRRGGGSGDPPGAHRAQLTPRDPEGGLRVSWVRWYPAGWAPPDATGGWQGCTGTRGTSVTAGRDGRAGSGDAVWTGTGTGCNSDLGTTVACGTTHDLAANARLSGSPVARVPPTDRGAHDPCALPSSRWRSPPSRSVSPPARPRKPAGPTRRLRPRWRPAARRRVSPEAPRRAPRCRRLRVRLRRRRRARLHRPRRADRRPSGSAPASAATGEVVTVTATNITWEQADLEVPADTPFTLELVNNDASVPHNVEIRDQAGTSVFNTETFPGVETRSFDAPALTAGPYQFVCTVHPNMIIDVNAT